MNNLLILIGRLTRNPEIRYTNYNKAVADISIAVSNGKEDTTYLNVLAFGTTAENVNKYCKKGDLIGIQGLIKNNNWEDKEGKRHYGYSFLANRITFLSTKKEECVEPKKEEDPFADFGEEVDINNFLD